MQIVQEFLGKEVVCEYFFDDMEYLAEFHFREFGNYYKKLLRNGVIKETKTGNYEWAFSDLSLVEFFMHINTSKRKNMEWQELERIFTNIKPGTLRKSAYIIKKGTKDRQGEISRATKQKSKDFEKIIKIILGRSEIVIKNGIEWRLP
jgi:hypothetical protein